MALLDDINRLLRDHTGYTGDGHGGSGALPVGDRSTARWTPDMRDLRELLRTIAQTMGDEGALQEILNNLANTASVSRTERIVADRTSTVTLTNIQGSPNDITAEITPAAGYTTLGIGQGVMFAPRYTNTGPADITINGVRYRIFPASGDAAALPAGALQPNRHYQYRVVNNGVLRPIAPHLSDIAGLALALDGKVDASDWAEAALLPAARPGDTPGLHGTGIAAGQPEAIDPLTHAVVTQDGAVGRIVGAGIISDRRLTAMEPDRKYRVRFVLRRGVNSANRSSVIRLGVAWYDRAKVARVPAYTVVSELTDLTTSDGRTVVEVTVARTAPADFVAPSGTIYTRPYVQSTDADGAIDVEILEITDLTGLVSFAPDVSDFASRLGAMESADLPARLANAEADIGTSSTMRFASRGDAMAADIRVSAEIIDIPGLGAYRRDPAGTAIVTADGARWSPIGVPTPEQFGAVGDGVADDTAALSLWGTLAGRVMLRGTYRIASQINVAASRIDARGARLIYDGSNYGQVIRLTSPGARWVGGELDCAMKASTGFYSDAGGCVVEEAEIHSMRSLTGQCTGIWMVGPGGGTARNCEIYDLSATGDGSPGGGNGPCRAVLMSSTTALTAPFVIEGNNARQIAGEEGDAYQILVFDGTYPFLSAAWSLIRGNTARGFNRRGIKIQASKVICEDNFCAAPGVTAGLGPQSVIEVIASNDVIIRRNITEASAGMRGVAVLRSFAPEPLTGIIVSGHVHVGVADADSVALSGVAQSVAIDNIHTEGRRAVYVVDSEQTVIRGNIAAKSVTDGTYTDFEIGPSNTRMLADSNVSLGGTKYAALGAKSPLSIFRNTVSLRATGAVVNSAATAVDGLIVDTAGMSDAGAVVAGLVEGATTISRTVQLGTFGSELGANDFWVSGIPTSTRPDRFHTRGNIAWNGGTGAEKGWRCSASGTPGTWVAF